MLLRDAISKLERVARSMPATVQAAHMETYNELKSSLKDVAANALLPNVNDDQKQAAQAFIDTFTAHNAANVMRFTLSERQSIEALDSEITAADVEAWVRAGAANNSTDNTQGKVLGPEDTDIEATVRRMIGILVLASGSKIGEAQADARSKYLPYISRFLASIATSEQDIKLWSQIILTSWVAYVRLTWPGIARRHIRAAFR